MKASELRIGNYIQDRGDKIWAIDHWENSYKVASKTPIIYVDETFGEMLGHPLTEEIKYVKPIPLTEEWLLKFGFEKSTYNLGRSYYWLKPNSGFIFGIQLPNKIIPWFDVVNSMLVKLDYVHQLQNLYFALTGEELTLK